MANHPDRRKGRRKSYVNRLAGGKTARWPSPADMDACTVEATLQLWGCSAPRRRRHAGQIEDRAAWGAEPARPRMDWRLDELTERST